MVQISHNVLHLSI